MAGEFQKSSCDPEWIVPCWGARIQVSLYLDKECTLQQGYQWQSGWKGTKMHFGKINSKAGLKLVTNNWKKNCWLIGWKQFSIFVVNETNWENKPFSF